MEDLDAEADEILVARLYFTPNGMGIESPQKKIKTENIKVINQISSDNTSPSKHSKTGDEVNFEKARIVFKSNPFKFEKVPKNHYSSDSETNSDFQSIELSSDDDEGTLTLSEHSSDTDELGLDIEGDEENNRYFGKKKSSNAKCYNCGLLGHIAKDCIAKAIDMICSLCIKQGHSKQECPNQVCFNCKLLGHQSRICPSAKKRYSSERDICSLCDNPGHLSQSCNCNTWRNYIYNRRNTKTPITARLKSSELDLLFTKLTCYCFNCAKSGHFGDECKKSSNRSFEDRWSPFHQYSDVYLKHCLFEKSFFYSDYVKPPYQTKLRKPFPKAV